MPALPSSATKGFRRPEAADHVEAALGRALGALFRHKATGVGTDAQRDVEHRLGRRHLEIERLLDRGLEPLHVVVVDMAAVLAQMRGDPVGAGLDGEEGGANGIGRRAAARVAEGRDVVDVDAEVEARSSDVFLRFVRRAPASDRLPGLTAGSAASSGGSASAG